MRRVRAWRPLRRSRERAEGPITRTVDLSGSAHAAGSASAVLIKAGEAVEVRITRLEARLEQAEQQAAKDRSHAREAERQISERLVVQGMRLNEADGQLRELARSVAVSSARLQIVGLILVGVGTVVMAVPALVVAF